MRAVRTTDRFEKEVDLGGQPDAVFPRNGQPRISRSHCRVDHNKIGLAKIFFAMPSEMECGDWCGREALQRVG